MIKIFNLNLWRYNDFEKRLINIVKKIEDLSPDIIFLQETQLDQRCSFLTQTEIIKNKLNSDYKYSLQTAVYKKDKQAGVILNTQIDHGMAIISKYPVLNSFEYYLKKDTVVSEPRSVLFFDLDMCGVIHKFINIHFTNNEKIALQEFMELFELIENRKEKRLLIGDFNMFNFSEHLRQENLLFKKIKENFKLSYDFKKYVSYEKDAGTLDYILIPNNYDFLSVDCLEEYMSDHKALFTTISYDG